MVVRENTEESGDWQCWPRRLMCVAALAVDSLIETEQAFILLEAPGAASP